MTLTKKQIEEKYDVDSFFKQYIGTALWSSIGDDEKPLDGNYDEEDISDEALEEMKDDCIDFISQADQIDGFEDLDMAMCGHDFWLTRERHGAGFWDGDYEETMGQKLTDLSHGFGSCYIYLGDDGKLYVQ
jgi:hypothetical protein